MPSLNPQMSPAAWLQILEPMLVEQARVLREYDDYYDGRHRLAFATAKFRESFGALFTALADNWCEVVVDAAVERLRIEGFSIGQGGTAMPDAELQEVWWDNALEAEATLAHTEAVKGGRSYVLVEPGATDRVSPTITVEHGSQVVVAHAPGNRRNRLAALKRWADEDGFDYAVVYTQREVAWFRSREKRSQRRRTYEGTGRNWVAIPEWWKPNTVGPAVPVVPLYNNPTMLGGGRSDLLPAIPLQDAINKLVADMLVASEFAAFPQRVAIGIEVPTDPVTGQPTKAVQLAAAVSRFWAFEDPDAKVASFAAADLGNYVKGIETLLQHLAAQTRTPPHYLLGNVVNASGDALKAAETGLVSRVSRKQTDFGDGWNEVGYLVKRLKGKRDERPRALWGDAETRSEGESVDAAVKLRGIGVPLEALWRRIGATPQEVQEWKRLTGLPERPPAGATTSQVPAVLDGGETTPGGAVLPRGVQVPA